ncbi:hypothetical protein N8751_00220 [bacterium]|nr:hypothetical protein [bacterium]
MSASSRVMILNYTNTRLHHKGIYDKIKPIESFCIICNTRNNFIRLNTCCYKCFEIKIKNDVKFNTKPKKRFSFDFIRRLFNFKTSN